MCHFTTQITKRKLWSTVFGEGGGGTSWFSWYIKIRCLDPIVKYVRRRGSAGGTLNKNVVYLSLINGWSPSRSTAGNFLFFSQDVPVAAMCHGWPLPPVSSTVRHNPFSTTVAHLPPPLQYGWPSHPCPTRLAPDFTVGYISPFLYGLQFHYVKSFPYILCNLLTFNVMLCNVIRI